MQLQECVKSDCHVKCSKINRKEEMLVGPGKGGEMKWKHAAGLTVNYEENDSYCGAFL
jgi:hypothetical protein